jgi:sucrose-phosphate synthase
MNFNRLFISDIDNTLLGDFDALQSFIPILQTMRANTGFGVATGRRLDSACEVLAEWGVPRPDFFITSVGSEIYLRDDDQRDPEWRKHLNYRWDANAIYAALADIPGLTPQPDIDQREFKVSYFVDIPGQHPPDELLLERIHALGFEANIIYSHKAYLDILPIRASKGRAVQLLARRWQIDLDKILVSGDSGNDEDMLTCGTLAVAVGNHSPDLAHLRDHAGVYVAKANYAAGILEGMRAFGFVAD